MNRFTTTLLVSSLLALGCAQARRAGSDDGGDAQQGDVAPDVPADTTRDPAFEVRQPDVTDVSTDPAFEDVTTDPCAACGFGTTCCASTCVDVRVDPSNCGTCGNRCATGSICSEGPCSTACTVLLTRVDCSTGLVFEVGTTGSSGGNFTFVHPCIPSITDVNCNTTSGLSSSGCPPGRYEVTHTPCDGSPACSATIDVVCP